MGQQFVILNQPANQRLIGAGVGAPIGRLHDRRFNDSIMTVVPNLQANALGHPETLTVSLAPPWSGADRQQPERLQVGGGSDRPPKAAGKDRSVRGPAAEHLAMACLFRGGYADPRAYKGATSLRPTSPQGNSGRFQGSARWRIGARQS